MMLEYNLSDICLQEDLLKMAAACNDLRNELFS